MKSALGILSLISLVSISSFAAAADQSLQCVNAAHSAITFSLSIDKETASIAFGATGNQNPLEKDLVGKKLNLALDNEASARGYIQYDGVMLVDKRYNESREIQIRIAVTEFYKTKDIRVIMSPSDSYATNLGASAFHQYDMKCQLK